MFIHRYIAYLKRIVKSSIEFPDRSCLCFFSFSRFVSWIHSSFSLPDILHCNNLLLLWSFSCISFTSSTSSMSGLIMWGDSVWNKLFLKLHIIERDTRFPFWSLTDCQTPYNFVILFVLHKLLMMHSCFQEFVSCGKVCTVVIFCHFQWFRAYCGIMWYIDYLPLL